MMLDVTGTGTVHLVVHVHDTYILCTYMHFQHGRLETNIVPVMLIGDFSDWGFLDLPVLLLMNRKYVFFQLKYTAAVNVIK